MDFDEIENLNPNQILEMYEDILETPVRIATTSYGGNGCFYVYNYAYGSVSYECENSAK